MRLSLRELPGRQPNESQPVSSCVALNLETSKGARSLPVHLWFRIEWLGVACHIDQFAGFGSEEAFDPKTIESDANMWLSGDCQWQPLQLEEELGRGEWLLFNIPGQHLVQHPNTRLPPLPSGHLPACSEMLCVVR